MGPVRDEPKEPTSPRRAPNRSARARFAMPPEPHDERVGERIEAFLEGPPRARRTRSRHLRNEALRRARPQVPLDTRADWNIALKAEEARMVRYLSLIHI